MTNEIDGRITEKCREIASEQDRQRMSVLIAELSQLFEEKDRLLKSQTPPSRSSF
ncbi:MAG TPA: hypothetical protein VH437_00895 [Terriglobales bacterium]|jgi:hypothetical protein